MISDLRKVVEDIIIIGVKSNIQNRDGIYFLTNAYIGSSISPINFGLNLIHASESHDRIISNTTI